MKKINIIFSTFIVLTTIIAMGCKESSVTVVNPEPNFIITKDLSYNIKITTEVSGTYNENAVIKIQNLSTTIGNFSMNPANSEIYNVKYSSSLQTVYINSIHYTAPSTFVPGQIHIDCEYTDSNGEYKKFYVGLIAAWIR